MNVTSLAAGCFCPIVLYACSPIQHCMYQRINYILVPFYRLFLQNSIFALVCESLIHFLRILFIYFLSFPELIHKRLTQRINKTKFNMFARANKMENCESCN
jgi:hypothetical protein